VTTGIWQCTPSPPHPPGPFRYTNQSCGELLAYFADVLPRSRNAIRTMEYSRGDLRGQVKELVARNNVLDEANRKSRGAKAGSGLGAGLTREVALLLYPNGDLGPSPGSNAAPLRRRPFRRLLGEGAVVGKGAASRTVVGVLSRGALGDSALGDSIGVGGGSSGGSRRRPLGSVSGFKDAVKKGKRPKDGVKFDEALQLWTASIDVGKSRYSLGKFKDQAAAQKAYQKEKASAQKLGYGDQDLDSPAGCESKLKKVYFDIHEVMLMTRKLDLQTAALRLTIAKFHERNRVLERQVRSKATCERGTFFVRSLPCQLHEALNETRFECAQTLHLPLV